MNLNQIIDPASGVPTLVQQTPATTPIVEPIDGPVDLANLISQMFPDSVYNTATDTHLYSYLQALCGDSGAGVLKQWSLILRLANEATYLPFQRLDAQYADTIKFPRLPDEFYQPTVSYSGQLGVNPASQPSFVGPQGDLPAASSLNAGQIFYATDYQTYLLSNGTTWNVTSIQTLDPQIDTLTPQEIAQVQQVDALYQARCMLFMQALRLGGTPAGLALAAESAIGMYCDLFENYKAYYDSISDNPLGLAFQGMTNSPYEYVIIPRLDPANPAVYQNSLNHYPVYGTTWQASTAYQLNDIVIPSPPNGHAYQCIVAGTTGASQPTWPFTDLTIDPFNPSVTKTGGTVTDNVVTWLEIGATVDQQTYDAAGHQAQNPDNTSQNLLLPAYQRNLLGVLDQMRPIGTFYSISTETPHYVPITDTNGTAIQPIVYGSSQAFTLSRFVTGNASVSWPTPGTVTGDRTQGNYIEAGVEKEAEQMPLSVQQWPAIFLSPETEYAFTEQALSDPTYDTSAFFQVPTNYGAYISQHIGPYHSTLTSIYTFLQAIPKTDLFSCDKSIAAQVTPLITIGRAV